MAYFARRGAAFTRRQAMISMGIRRAVIISNQDASSHIRRFLQGRLIKFAYVTG